MRKLKTRFTLIELLVVIAIIAILASLLLPSLNKAKDSAKRAACMGNLKQIGTTSQSYSDDYAGWLPQTTSANQAYWRYLLAPYAGLKPKSQNDPIIAKGIFRCQAWQLKNITPCYESGYGWNKKYLGFVGNTSGQAEYVKASAVPKPSATIAAGDGTDWTTSGGGGEWDYVKLYCPSETYFTPYLPIGNRHSKGLNCAYVDAHVDWKPQLTAMLGSNGDVDYYYKLSK